MQKYRWLFLGGSVMLFAALVGFFLDSPFRLSAGSEICNGSCSITETSVNDFVRGTFNYTGIRNISDGEVQLSPVGLTSPWTNDPYPLPAARVELAAAIFRNSSYNETIYVIGGFDGSLNPRAEIYTATTTSTGAIAAPGWLTAEHSPLDIPLAATQAVISPTSSGGFLYVLGGFTQDNGINVVTSTILYKQLGSSGVLPSGSWSRAEMPPSPLGNGEPLYSHQAFVRNGYLYVIGGADEFGNSILDTYRAPIQINGALGNWVADASSPITRRNFASTIWNSENNGDWLYLIGGLERKTETIGKAQVDYTYFKSDGALDDPFKTNEASALPVARYGHTAVQAGGVLYTIAGDQGGSGTDAITNTVLSGLIDSASGKVGQLAFPWIKTNPLNEGRKFHASVISHIGEIYVIGGYGPNGSNIVPKDTVSHGSTSGVGFLYVPEGNYASRIIDRKNNRYINDIKVNTTITASAFVTMTLWYRTGDSQAELLGKGWTQLGAPNTGENVNTTFQLYPSTVITNSLLQYKVFFTSTNTSYTPILNSFQINYPAPPTPTPTATSPVVILPDFTILGINAPAAAGSPGNQTMTIRVANLGNKAFSPNQVRTATPVAQPPRIQPPVIRPKPPVQIGNRRAPADDPYFAWIDLYIDRAIPSGVLDLGNCQDQSGQPVTRFVYVGDLPVFTYKDYQITCWLGANSHTFYAQIDTCDNPSDTPNYRTTCSRTAGYVLERNETNNIFGPVGSGSIITMTINNSYLPLIHKSQ